MPVFMSVANTKEKAPFVKLKHRLNVDYVFYGSSCRSPLIPNAFSV